VPGWFRVLGAPVQRRMFCFPFRATEVPDGLDPLEGWHKQFYDNNLRVRAGAGRGAKTLTIQVS
jgi:hypothetical protein